MARTYGNDNTIVMKIMAFLIQVIGRFAVLSLLLDDGLPLITILKGEHKVFSQFESCIIENSLRKRVCRRTRSPQRENLKTLYIGAKGCRIF